MTLLLIAILLAGLLLRSPAPVACCDRDTARPTTNSAGAALRMPGSIRYRGERTALGLSNEVIVSVAIETPAGETGIVGIVVHRRIPEHHRQRSNADRQRRGLYGRTECDAERHDKRDWPHTFGDRVTFERESRIEGPGPYALLSRLCLVIERSMIRGTGGPPRAG